jgi:hypothetical protein
MNDLPSPVKDSVDSGMYEGEDRSQDEGWARGDVDRLEFRSSTISPMD